MINETPEEIIKKHIKHLNNLWFSNKLQEFRTSPIYDSNKDILYYTNIEILQQTEEIFDDEGIIIGNTVIKEVETENTLSINFREFCSSSNYYSEEGVVVPYYLAEIESLVKGAPVKKYLFGLEEISQKLTDEMKRFKDELNSENIWDFISTTIEYIKVEFNNNFENPEGIYKDLREDLCGLYSDKIFSEYSTKIFFNKIRGRNKDKLKISLNLEDFSAMLLLMSNANMIALERTNYDFFEKYVTLGTSKQVLFNSRNLEQRVSKQRRLNAGKGLDNIREAFAKPLNFQN